MKYNIILIFIFYIIECEIILKVKSKNTKVNYLDNCSNLHIQYIYSTLLSKYKNIKYDYKKN